MKKVFFLLWLLPCIAFGQRLKLNQLPMIGNSQVFGSNGSGVPTLIDISSLAGSGTTTNALTTGWGLTSGGTFNGAVARTFAADTTTGHLATQYYVTQAILSGGSGGDADSLGGQLPAYYLNRTNHTGTQAWSTITSTPTTRSGYGITDAVSNVLSSGNIIVGNGSNVASPVTMSGDGTLSNAGVLTLTARTYSVNATINSGDPLAGGEYADVYMPFGATITGWLVYAQNGESGSASVELRESSNTTRASFSSISASAPITLTATTEAASTTLTGWTTAVPSGRWLRFYLSTVSTLTAVSIQLTYTR